MEQYLTVIQIQSLTTKRLESIKKIMWKLAKEYRWIYDLYLSIDKLSTSLNEMVNDNAPSLNELPFKFYKDSRNLLVLICCMSTINIFVSDS